MSEVVGVKFDHGKPRTDLITWEGLDLITAKMFEETRNYYQMGDKAVATAARSLASWSRDKGQNYGHLAFAMALTLCALQSQVSGGKPLREDAGLVTLHGSFSPALLSLGTVLAYGAKKYGPRNWEHGIVYTRYIAAAQRHLYAHLSGELLDPETGLPHLAHAACCLLFLSTYVARGRVDVDDREPAPTSAREGKQ